MGSSKPTRPRPSPYRAGVWVTGYARNIQLFGFNTHHKGHLFLLTSEASPAPLANAGYVQDVMCTFCGEQWTRVDGEWLQRLPTNQELLEYLTYIEETQERLAKLHKDISEEYLKV